jgi:hypothetical protein
MIRLIRWLRFRHAERRAIAEARERGRAER